MTNELFGRLAVGPLSKFFVWDNFLPSISVKKSFVAPKSSLATIFVCEGLIEWEATGVVDVKYVIKFLINLNFKF